VDLVNGVAAGYAAILALVLLLGSVHRAKLRSRPTALSRIMLFLIWIMLSCQTLSLLVFRPVTFVFHLLTGIGFLAFFAVLSFYLLYLRELLELDFKAARAAVTANTAVCLWAGAAWFVTCFHPFFFDIDAGAATNRTIFFLCCLPNVTTFLLDVVLLRIARKKLRPLDYLFLILTPLLPLISPLLSLIIPGLQMRYPLMLMSLYINNIHINVKLDERLEKTEQEAREYRLRTTLQRVKPHYVYNVLASIYYLCEKAPMEAQRAIGVFTDYLRNVLKTINEDRLVPFAWELDVIRNYLELEKLRFGDRIQVRFDVQEEDFLIPPLTVQPLVENAVKHGIGQRAQGGSLRIVSEKVDGGYRVTVEDDGVGFSPAELERDTDHTGIRNIREALALICGGTVDIRSAPGEGAAVSVFFPQTPAE